MSKLAWLSAGVLVGWALVSGAAARPGGDEGSTAGAAPQSAGQQAPDRPGSDQSTPARPGSDAPAPPDREAARSGESGAQKDSPGKEENHGLFPRVKVETDLGDFIIELNGERAPLTVNNFLRYVEEKYFDGVIFHRIVVGKEKGVEIVETGAYTDLKNERKPGRHDPIYNESQNGLKNLRGTVAMAREIDDYHSADTRWYVNLSDNEMCDFPSMTACAVFGKVIAGMEVIDNISRMPTQQSMFVAGEDSAPREPVRIKSVRLMGTYDREKFQELVRKYQAIADKQLAAYREALRKQREQEAAARGGQPPAQAEGARAARPTIEPPISATGVEDFVRQAEARTSRKVEKTASGLMYVVLHEGSGPSPKPTDKVQVHYRGTLLDGKEFDSSYKAGKPLEFPLDKVIRGWTEGVGMMKVGERRLLIIPPGLAYGKEGVSGLIPPDSTLVFEVELLGIK